MRLPWLEGSRARAVARAELTSVPVMCPLSQGPLGALSAVVQLYGGQRGADLCPTHTSTHRGPGPGLLRADGHVRGKLHAHARHARALLCSLLRRSGVLCRLCPRREWIAEQRKRKLDGISTSVCLARRSITPNMPRVTVMYCVREPHTGRVSAGVHRRRRHLHSVLSLPVRNIQAGCRFVCVTWKAQNAR